MGDKVWSRNLATGRDELVTVTKVFTRLAAGLVKVTTTSGSVTGTGTHPFYIHGRGWAPAAGLSPGDEITGPGGTTDTVISVTPSTPVEPKRLRHRQFTVPAARPLPPDA